MSSSARNAPSVSGSDSENAVPSMFDRRRPRKPAKRPLMHKKDDSDKSGSSDSDSDIDLSEVGNNKRKRGSVSEKPSRFRNGGAQTSRKSTAAAKGIDLSDVDNNSDSDLDILEMAGGSKEFSQVTVEKSPVARRYNEDLDISRIQVPVRRNDAQRRTFSNKLSSIRSVISDTKADNDSDDEDLAVVPSKRKSLSHIHTLVIVQCKFKNDAARGVKVTLDVPIKEIIEKVLVGFPRNLGKITAKDVVARLIRGSSRSILKPDSTLRDAGILPAHDKAKPSAVLDLTFPEVMETGSAAGGAGPGVISEPSVKVKVRVSGEGSSSTTIIVEMALTENFGQVALCFCQYFCHGMKGINITQTAKSMRFVFDDENLDPTSTAKAEDLEDDYLLEAKVPQDIAARVHERAKKLSEPLSIVVTKELAAGQGLGAQADSSEGKGASDVDEQEPVPPPAPVVKKKIPVLFEWQDEDGDTKAGNFTCYNTDNFIKTAKKILKSKFLKEILEAQNLAPEDAVPTVRRGGPGGRIFGADATPASVGLKEDDVVYLEWE